METFDAAPGGRRAVGAGGSGWVRCDAADYHATISRPPRPGGDGAAALPKRVSRNATSMHATDVDPHSLGVRGGIKTACRGERAARFLGAGRVARDHHDVQRTLEDLVLAGPLDAHVGAVVEAAARNVTGIE